MQGKRRIEIFSAGCPACQATIDLVNRIACPSCDISVLDMHEAHVAERARTLGVQVVPAVVIDGRLADCCAGRVPDEKGLRVSGIG